MVVVLTITSDLETYFVIISVSFSFQFALVFMNENKTDGTIFNQNKN